jgi:subtilisin-like proprotein convertase family protein
MKPILVALALLALALSPLRADVYSGSLSATWSGTQAIPDNNASGVAFSFNISTPVYAAVTNLTLDLNLSGGWNGDLYAYLSHGNGFVVLFNRIGRTSATPFGSGSSGMSIELSDSYPSEIHQFSGPALTGNFAPDGRNVSPYNALDTDPRSAFFSSFAGLDVSGNWTLFLSDVSPAAVSTVQSWTLNLGVTTIPEPATGTLMVVGVAWAMRRRIPQR